VYIPLSADKSFKLENIFSENRKMTTLDDIIHSRPIRGVSERLALLNNGYSRQYAAVTRIGLEFFVESGEGEIVRELEGGLSFRRMFTAFEVLKTIHNRPHKCLMKRTLIFIDEIYA
jgi:hypothetical protein